MRTAIAGYRSEGLQAEMGRARLALESAGVRLEYFAQPVELDPARETVLALALREAVTNVVRHAGARTCRITLEQTAEETPAGGARRRPRRLGARGDRPRLDARAGRGARRHGWSASAETGTSLRITLPRRQSPRLAGTSAALTLKERPA